MHERPRIAIKHSGPCTLAFLELLVEDLNFTPISARSYHQFLKIHDEYYISLVAILYHLNPHGEPYAQQKRKIYPLEIINTIKHKKKIPFIALYSPAPNSLPLEIIRSYGVADIIQSPFSKDILEQTLTNLGIEKPHCYNQ